MTMANLTLAGKNVVQTSHSNKAWPCIGYPWVWEVERETLRKLGEKPDDYGLHSFRAGGATAAANAGVEDQLFKRQGQ